MVEIPPKAHFNLMKVNLTRKEARNMGIINQEDLIAWRDGNKIICASCGDPGEGKPLTKDDFEEGAVVTCDDCGERIL